jgi:hypothetical protein
MPSASPPIMKLFRTLAGMCVFALAALPAVAQRGGGASHGGGGGGRSYGGGGGSHASEGGGRSYGGGSSEQGSSYSVGHVSGGESGGNRGYSESYSYPGTGTHFTGGASEFTNHGGIRFSDFGLEESPRFTASMLTSRPAAPTAPHGYEIEPAEKRSAHDGSRRMDGARFDHRDYGYRRYSHYGYVFFGAFGVPLCGSYGLADYDQFSTDVNAYGCSGAEWLSDDAAPYSSDDQSTEYEDSSADDAAADSSSDAAAPDSAPAQHEDAAPQTTLLQLKDGSMYGLSAYWVDGGELHYVTNYGGANAIALDEIDLAKTVQLNAAHGQAFVLAEKPAAPAAKH